MREKNHVYKGSGWAEGWLCTMSRTTKEGERESVRFQDIICVLGSGPNLY